MSRLPVRGTSGSAGYDLAAVQAVVVPAHSKCLVKTGLAMAPTTWLLREDSPEVRTSLKKVY